MSSWKGKSKGKPWGYSIFLIILRTFGVTPAYWLLRFVSLYYVIFSYQSSKSIYYYFHKRLGYGAIKSFWMVSQNYYVFGQSIIDKVVVMSGIRNKFTFEFDGRHNLDKIAAMGKGGLLLSAHIGSWEIAGDLLKQINTCINIVMYDGEDQQIKAFMERVTGKLSVNIIVIKDDLSHIFKINEAFQNKELVCMHADRYLEGNKTILKKFLGKDARFPLGPFIMAAKFKVPVAYVFAMKETRFHYHFYASTIKEYLHLGQQAGIAQMTSDFVEEMEKYVKKYPGQWYNYYNFWQ
jgi:predicted LPLAT superfamily acyltransferase